MKSTKDFRPINGNDGDSTKKATKLEPIKKSGREKSTLFKSTYDEDEEDDDLDYKQLKRESILDYFDDGLDPDELDDQDIDDELDDQEDFEDEDEDEDFEEEDK